MSKQLPNSPISLKIYTSVGRISDPLWKMALAIRAKKGKEHPIRKVEKLGQASQIRPNGKLIWLHGVSVGESLALKPLIETLTAADENIHCLLTTSTTGSWDAWEKIGLPERTIHQFAPIDCYNAVHQFLDHWRPDAIALSERDFWPGLIRWSQVWAKGHVPVLLINSRLSDASLKRRSKAQNLYSCLLNGFDQILLQDEHSFSNFEKIGVATQKLQVVGSVKSAAAPLDDLPELSQRIRACIGTRPAWLAASTHIKETQNLIAAHKLAKEKAKKLISIIAPRKPEAVIALEEHAQSQNLKTIKSSQELPENTDADILIVDSIGEMGAWFRASQIVFMGFSLPDDDTQLTGKNPFEALALDRGVVHGPHTTNFAESYAKLQSAGATRLIRTNQELADYICDPIGLEHQKEAARAYLAQALEPLKQTANIILQSMEKPQV